VSLSGDQSGIDFKDQTTRTFSGYVLGGCNIYIGQATLRISSTDNPDQPCLQYEMTTAENTGYYEIELPARTYQVEVVAFTPAAGQSILPDDVINYFSVEQVDLTDRSSEKDFIFRRKPEIEILFPEFAATCPDFPNPVIHQGIEYPVTIRVVENFAGETCPVDTGYVIIYDEIGDRESEPDTLPLKDGEAAYRMFPGNPNLISPHLKTLQVEAFVGQEEANASVSTLVLGNRPRTETFVTTTPEIPFIILRDPPGDESYSFLERSLTSTRSISFFGRDASPNGIGFKPLKFGVKLAQSIIEPNKYNPPSFNIPKIEEFSVLGIIKGLLEAGMVNWDHEEIRLEFTTKERFETSASPDFIGAGGDLYAGYAMNLSYALTDVIDFDPAACAVVRDTTVIMSVDDIPTTFIYTDHHIRHTLIPQLKQIRDQFKGSPAPDSSYVFYDNQISVWEQVVQKNADLKRRAVENTTYSIDGGARFQTSTTIDSLSSNTLEFSIIMNERIATASKLGIDIPLIGEIGITHSQGVTFRTKVGVSKFRSARDVQETGYVLQDNDPGDFLSIKVKDDNVYGTPVFELLNGRTSCPNEPNTQPREGVQLRADKLIQRNVPADGQAEFKLFLGNISQSDENRTYELYFLPESNPDGAVVRIGGNPAAGPIKVPIISGARSQFTVSVSRQNQAYSYEDLAFVLRSNCEDERIADTVKLSVYFAGPCSDIAIQSPAHNWVVNNNAGDHVLVKLGGYDKAALDRIQIQYSPLQFNNWINSVIIVPEELLDPSVGTVVEWQTEDIPDGEYKIRALLECGAGYTYSGAIEGVIDRQAPRLFGKPGPDGGVYDGSAPLRVVFDEAVNCNTFTENDIFIQDDTGVFFTTASGCAGNTILMNPDIDIDSYAGATLNVSMSNVEDVYGNRVDSVITWTFTVAGNGAPSVNNDYDNDGIFNDADNCPLAANTLQEDTDTDGKGDVCDHDKDNDGIPNAEDNCPVFFNPDQSDQNQDGIGDICDPASDGDGDGIANESDNCPSTSNPGQADQDMDGIGDVCDDDIEGDGVLNFRDNCPVVSNFDQADSDGDGTGDACATTSDVELKSESLHSVTIFPNPAGHEVRIQLILTKAADIQMNVFDVLGRRIFFEKMQHHPDGLHTKTLRTEDWPNGLYVVQVRVDGQQYNRQLIIQH
jgi:hypothetical protein